MKKSKSKGSCKYYAYNMKVKVPVRWLGCAATKTAMDKRLKQYDAPPHIVTRKGKPISVSASIRRIEAYGKKRGYL